MAPSAMQAKIEWSGELQFHGDMGGRHIELNGDARAGCSPMELLMISLAGCMAIDVVHILGKMRAGLKSVTARVEGTRAETEPRRFTKLNLRFDVGGSELAASQVERAIALSKEKYCSVYHSLRTDIEITTTFALV
jgi:putative redox protein